MRRMGIDPLFGCVQPSTGPRHWSMQEAGTGSFSTLVSTTGNWSCYLAYTTLMPTDSSRNWRLRWIFPWSGGQKLWLLMGGSATDDEEGSTDAVSDTGSDPDDPTIAWCPPMPEAADDPTELPGSVTSMWLQARLQLTLPAIQEKFSRILVSAAGELWLRGQGVMIEDVLLRLARALTVRLAEKLAQALSAMMRLAESMVTPETECLLYATYWFCPILSELLHTARESAELNKNRAPSGPVKVLVTDRQPKRHTNIVDICSGASSLLAWFPASWASKIAPEFLANPTENGQRPQILSIACPKRVGGDASAEGEKQTLQAVRFAAKNMPFLDLAIDKELREADFFCKTYPWVLRGARRAEHDASSPTCGAWSHHARGHHPIAKWPFPWEVERDSYTVSSGLAVQL